MRMSRYTNECVESHMKSIVSYLKVHLNKSDVTRTNKPLSFQILNDLFACAFRYDCVVSSSHMWTSNCISESITARGTLSHWYVCDIWIRHMWHKWMSHGIHTWISHRWIGHTWISYMWFIHQSHANKSSVTQMNEPWHTHVKKSFVTRMKEPWNTPVNQSFVTHMNEPWHTRVNKSYVTQMNEPWHTHAYGRLHRDFRVTDCNSLHSLWAHASLVEHDMSSYVIICHHMSSYVTHHINLLHD